MRQRTAGNSTKTLTGRIVAHILAQGCVEVDPGRGSRRKFAIPGSDEFYLLGTGTLRKGKAWTNSMSCQGTVEKWQAQGLV